MGVQRIEWSQCVLRSKWECVSKPTLGNDSVSHHRVRGGRAKEWPPSPTGSERKVHGGIIPGKCNQCFWVTDLYMACSNTDWNHTSKKERVREETLTTPCYVYQTLMGSVFKYSVTNLPQKSGSTCNK